jgi:agmatine deiminase
MPFQAQDATCPSAKQKDWTFPFGFDLFPRLKSSGEIMSPHLLLAGLCLAPLLHATSSGIDFSSPEWKARTEAWLEEHPASLPHWPTPEEASGLYDSRVFTETDPPLNPRSIAEFERMAAVMIRYPFGIPYSLIQALADNHPLVTIVSGVSQENTVRSLYTSQGVNLDNCSFLHAPTNSYWTRDYGPWFVQNGAEIAVMDFPYNRPRPSDDEIPVELAAWWNLPLYGMNLYHTGGNWMSDGYGKAASSDLVMTENPGMNDAEVGQLVQDYLGVDTYHRLPDPNNTYIDHIDCWGKFLDVDKVLIRSVPMSHAQYDEIEAVADYFASSLSGWNRPYQVIRVYTPDDEPYTNSLIVNGHVYVPLTGGSWDDEAIATYESALPGCEISGYVWSSWYSTDALHCRTKGLADPGLLHLHHIPLPDTLSGQSTLDFESTITACSGQSLITDSLALRWRMNGGEWQQSPLAEGTDGIWTASLPASDGLLEYVLQAADASGRYEQHPFAGSADPHQVQVINSLTGLEAPELQITLQNGQVLLQWNAVAGAGSYRIEMANALTGEWSILDDGLVATSTILPVEAGTWLYRVRAQQP